MERERLARLLEEPGRMAREDLAGLKALAEKYPWFSGAQLLHTAGERMSGDVLFDETLRTTSAHLPSRAVLYDLVTAPPPTPVKLHVVKSAPVAIPPVGERAPAPVPLVEEAPPLPAPAPPPAKELSDKLAAPPAIEVEFEPPPPVSVQVSAQSSALGDELEEQIMRSAMSGAYDLTLREQLADITSLAKPADPASTEAPGTPPRKWASASSRLSFGDWLADADEHDRTSAPLVENGDEAIVSVEASAAVEHLPTADLIERFIQQANPAPPQKPPFFAPQQAGKRSLDDTVGLVTETLARIYVKQGNLPKAIATYGRLALKHPGKGAYFAALQKELEAQLNK